MDYYERQGKAVLVLLVTGSHELQVNGQKRYGDKLLLPNGKPSPVVSVHDRIDDRSDEITAEQCAEKVKVTDNHHG